MQKPAVTVMVKAARLAGNVLLRNINKLEALNVVQKGRCAASPITASPSPWSRTVSRSTR